MNWQLLEKAIRINGVTDLVFNKVDVLEGVGQWSIYDNDIKKDFQTSNAMREWLTARTQNLGVKNINFSGNKERI